MPRNNQNRTRRKTDRQGAATKAAVANRVEKDPNVEHRAATPKERAAGRIVYHAQKMGKAFSQAGPDTVAPSGGAAQAPWRTRPATEPPARSQRGRRPGRW